MAREKMVTRTIVTTDVSVLCVNIETSEVKTRTFVLSSTEVKDEKKMLSAAQYLLNEMEEEKTWKAVAVKDCKECETLYGMTEQEFLKYAKVLPPR